MGKKTIGVYYFGIWAILSGAWYLLTSVKALTPFLKHITEAQYSSVQHNALVMLLIIGVVAVFMVVGYNFIRLKRFSLYLITLIFIVQFFCSLFVILFVPSEPFFLNITVPKIFYLVWFLISPIIGLGYVIRKSIKQLFGVKPVTG